MGFSDAVKTCLTIHGKLLSTLKNEVSSNNDHAKKIFTQLCQHNLSVNPNFTKSITVQTKRQTLEELILQGRFQDLEELRESHDGKITMHFGLTAHKDSLELHCNFVKSV